MTVSELEHKYLDIMSRKIVSAPERKYWEIILHDYQVMKCTRVVASEYIAGGYVLVRNT